MVMRGNAQIGCQPVGDYLDIVTVTKDDLEGVRNTVTSTRTLRETAGVRQIVVDSSTNEVREALEELLRSEINIEYVWQEPSGIAAAFNLGLGMASGEWVWFLNGRDEVHPDLAADNFRYLLHASKADAIIFELELMQSRTRDRHPPLWDQWPPVFNWIPHPATIVRRKMFEQYGNFDEAYTIAMDGELWFRFFSGDAVVDMLSMPITLYDESGISTVQEKTMAGEVNNILRSNLMLLFKMWFRNGKKVYYALQHFRNKATQSPHDT